MPSRVRQSTAGPPPTRTELPQYEAPTFALSPAAQRTLSQLRHTHGLQKLADSLSEAVAALTNTAGDINERLTEKERAFKKRRMTPTSSQQPSSSNDDDAEQRMEELRERVENMTRRMEEGLRKIIDGQHGVQSVKESLAGTIEKCAADAATQTGTQGRSSQRISRRRAGNEEDEDEDDEEYQDFEPTDPAADPQKQDAPIDVFRSRVETAKTRYQSHSLRERYSNNNDYRSFKKMVHHARHPDEDVPMQHQDEWFDEGPAPAPGVTTRARAGADGDDEDEDDIAVARATISTKCPLTLQEFREPLTSNKCPHSFESEAILEMIRTNRIGGRPGPRGNVIGAVSGVQCPVPGCSQELTREDLHSDAILIRKIKRLQRAKQLEEEEGDEEGETRTPGATQRRAQVIDDEDEDDEDDGDDIDALLDRKDFVLGTQMKAERNTRQSSQYSAPRSTGVITLGSDSEAEEDDG